MTYSANWLRFRKTEDEYFTSRSKVMQDEKMLSCDLQLALNSVHDQLTALRLLVDTTPKFAVVAPLVPLLVDAVVDSGQLTVIGLAKEVLYYNRNEPQMRSDIVALVDGYLTSSDEWHYRRIAELYKLLNYTAELGSLVTFYHTNDNPEIREIGEDFRSSQKSC